MDLIAITMEPPATIRPSIQALLLVSLMGWVTSCGQGLVEREDPGETPQTSPSLQNRSGKTSADRTFDQWLKQCQNLPSNRLLKGAMPERSLLPIQDPESLTRMLDLFIEQQLNGPLSKSEAWVRPLESKESFLNPSTAYFEKVGTPFMPFAMKLALPPDHRVMFHGDLHGDIHSLNTWLRHLNQEGVLEGFRIASSKDHMVFLGDYTDRGSYGVEVMYVLMRLKVENPDQVWMARGNHEDIQLTMNYGFLREATAKYGPAFPIKRFSRLYDFLPVVIYVGSADDFVQCNHGGVEPGYNPERLLRSSLSIAFDPLGTLEQKGFLNVHPQARALMSESGWSVAQANYADFKPLSPTVPKVIGFMWNDFSISREEPQLSVDPGRAFVYGHALTSLILDQGDPSGKKVRCVFRAHQHSSVSNPMMRRIIQSGGVFRHWQERATPNARETPELVKGLSLEKERERVLVDGAVYTFNVSPDSYYGAGNQYDFDAFGRLLLKARFEDWKLQVNQLKVQP